MKNKKFNRRNFLHKIVGITALGGIASLILGNKVEKAHGALSGSISADQIAYGTGVDTIGGSNNLRWDNAFRNFIGGYSGNSVTSGVYGATISGGGVLNYENKVTDIYGTVGGGRGNQAGDNDANILDALDATVGGGFVNTASGQNSTVGAGANNTASANFSIIGGGNDSNASGQYATVPGGRSNSAAGDYSLAAGRRAKIGAAHDGTFLFADSTDANFNSARAKEFAVRCTNGSRFVAGSSNPAVKGNNTGTGDGIRGKSSASSGNGVGVQGFGNISESEGSAGTGVRGVGSDIGVKAESTSGTALHVEGKNYFKSAQKGTIPTDVRSHNITVPSGITIGTNAIIFVTIMNNSSNIGVRWVERLSDTQFRVHLTGLSRNDMNIGYFIVN